MRLVHGGAVALSFTLAALLLPMPAAACGGGCMNEIQFLGWTRDSQYAVYKETTVCRPDDGDEPGEGGDYTFTVKAAIDGRTGEVHKRMVKFVGQYSFADRAGWEALNTTRLEPPKKPLAPLHGKDRSPDGRRLLLLLDASGKNLLPRGSGVFHVSPIGEDGNAPELGYGNVTVAIDTGERTFFGRSWAPGECTMMPTGELTAYWSPDGQRIAFVGTKYGCMGFHESEVFVETVGEPTGPSVQLLADKNVPGERVLAAQAALEKAGVARIAVGPTKDPRTRTVVYFRKGNEEAAAAVANAVPGGAAVEPLTWRSPFDLVVALAAN